MVRKTKEDAEVTRQRIIHAAREMFSTTGVSKSSLEKVAKLAGVTRGAVYWHFENKTELFHAMHAQVFLPLIERIDATLLASSNEQNPLTRIENFLLDTIHLLNEDEVTRQTYEIIMSKCEYVDEFASVLQQILGNCSGIVENIERVYQDAHQQGLINPNLSPAQLAMDTHLFFSGLLHMWVKDSDGSRLKGQAETLIKAHINLRKK
ncbi:MAG: TetR family transcriptional regulator [Betaproteobacteria bacterium]|jgi:TetR/AcrR family transcriptional regulator, acrAB operon repressor|nr:TetR family transcriptional regulator [Betaproteobacteria bacterium]MCH9849556.1 TetR family transcriptional regulator [Betaproteobacteria bacterium]MDG1453515.1 TetR family transcriptional regulator [Methylophilaceae bacterium]